MNQDGDLHPLTAVGFTLLLAGFIGHAATSNWLYTLAGLGCLLASIVWAAVLTRTKHADPEEDT